MHMLSSRPTTYWFLLYYDYDKNNHDQLLAHIRNEHNFNVTQKVFRYPPSADFFMTIPKLHLDVEIAPYYDVTHKAIDEYHYMAFCNIHDGNQTELQILKDTFEQINDVKVVNYTRMIAMATT